MLLALILAPAVACAAIQVDATLRINDQETSEVFVVDEGQTVTRFCPDIEFTGSVTCEGDDVRYNVLIKDGQDVIAEPTMVAPWGIPVVFALQGGDVEIELEVVANELKEEQKEEAVEQEEQETNADQEEAVADEEQEVSEDAVIVDEEEVVADNDVAIIDEEVTLEA